MFCYLNNKWQNQDYRSCLHQEVLERLNGIEQNLFYYMDNECYERYIMKKTPDKLTEAEESHSVASENNGDDEMEPKLKHVR